MKLPLFGRARARLATSADVEVEIAEHRRLLGEATAALAALDATRSEVLIGDDVGSIREHRTRSDELRMTIDRLEARLGALDVQAAEIAAAEARKALDGRRAAVEARAAEMASWLRDSYPDLARELVAALTELHAIEREASAVNSELFEAGREVDQVAGVHARLGIILGPGEGMDAGITLAPETSASLGSVIRVPELTGGLTAPGWRAPAWS